MTQLLIYLAGLGLVVLGALGFIAALSIPGRIRMLLACLAACVPVAAGIWLFRSSGIRLSDFNRLLASANQDVQQLTRDLKEAQSLRGSFQELLR